MSCITGWRGSIAQNLEHRFVALFLCKQFGNVFAVLVLVDDDVLWRRDEAVLDATIAPETLLIGTGVEETDIERVVFLQLGQEDGVGVRVGIVLVFAVAGQSAKEDTLVFAVPMVDGEHDKTLVDTPGVGESGDK